MTLIALNLPPRSEVNTEINAANSTTYTAMVTNVEVTSAAPTICARGDIIMMLIPRINGANTAAVPFIMSVIPLSLLDMSFLTNSSFWN